MSTKNPLGNKIRQLREAQNLSPAALAERSGVSEDLIGHLEAGELVPSLTPLLKIARGLGARLGTFLDDAPQANPVVVHAGRSDKVVRFSGNNRLRDESKLDFFCLASDKQDRHMEPFLIDIHPAGQEQCQPSSHEGEEFIYVLSGEVEIAYGQERYALSAGDSIYYDSVVPHDVHAAGNADARILAVVYAPF